MPLLDETIGRRPHEKLVVVCTLSVCCYCIVVSSSACLQQPHLFLSHVFKCVLLTLAPAKRCRVASTELYGNTLTTFAYQSAGLKYARRFKIGASAE